MNLGTLVRAGLRHHWRLHLGVLCGAALATATLTGALTVGDSVRGTLARRAAERIGSVDLALVAGDRTFRTALADELTEDGDTAAAVVALRGVVSTADRGRRVHEVGVHGVDERYFELSPSGRALAPPEPGHGRVSAELALRLDVDPAAIAGTTIVLRVDRPSAIPRDMALAPDDVTHALRIEIDGVLDPGDFGRFALHAGHVPPANLFVERAWLAEELELGDAVSERANLLLVDVAGELEAGFDTRRAAVEARFEDAWSLDDAQLRITEVRPGTSELATDRIFFDAPVVESLEGPAAQEVGDLGGVFTYFVNALRTPERTTPYSMVTGLGALAGELRAGWPDLVPSEPDGIVVNRWLADDLELAAGDELTIDYWVVGSAGRLVERSHAFDVERVVELAGRAADPSWMPAFPGLADAENCRDWEPGTPVDLDRIRDVDEAYWDDHGGTPKAFVTLARARELWTSRFGTLSAVRFDTRLAPRVRELVTNGVAPARLGLVWRDVRTPALAASDSPTDFGGLFIGLSFFLIVAALLLTAQLALFGVEARARELGLFAALGFTERRIGRVVLAEMAVLATLGGLAGLPLGLAYTRAVLFGLTTAWAGAVAGVEIDFFVRSSTLATGLVSSIVATLGAVVLALRRRLRDPITRLAARRPGDEIDADVRGPKGSLVLASVALLGAVGLLVLVDPSSGTAAAGSFFGAGALLLVAGLALVRAFLVRRPPGSGRLQSLGELARRNARRRPGRSLTTAALMAIGTFLVLAVGVNRIGPTPPGSDRGSGTGGFAFHGRTSLAVVHDLDSAAGRDFYALAPERLSGVEIVPLRVRSGDDASCLSLARPERPRLLGVEPDELARRGAFTFADTIEPTDAPWQLLSERRADGAVGAIGDTTSLTWQLKKSVGDRITYVDERGEPFDVVIVGAIADTILQGDLIIANERFEERFPTEGGYRRFLVDAPLASRDAVRTELERGLSDVGLALEPAEERLDAFHAVQNTYLTIFELLGALGVLLGGVGLGAVCLRNTLERRPELALCAALGFPRRRIRWLVVSEYGALLILGALVGGVAALCAVIPSSDDASALGRTLWMLAAIVANGAFWILIAVRGVDARAPQRVLCEE